MDLIKKNRHAMLVNKVIATCGGIGYLKGGGTVAALLYTILWLVIRPLNSNMPVQVILFLLLMIVGVLISNKLETIWGKDSGKIVIDEVAGMCCTLLFVPFKWQYALAGFVLFRFFDIVKPLFISSAEKLPGGWGVMTDDAAAGICANLLLQVIVITKVF
ncbi:MAG: phosphatidylglycerophosphatase A [Bacteroidota bacterium]